MTLETQNTWFSVHTFKFQNCFLLPCRLYKVVDLKRVAINGSELVPMWGRRDLFCQDDYLRAFAKILDSIKSIMLQLFSSRDS